MNSSQMIESHLKTLDTPEREPLHGKMRIVVHIAWFVLAILSVGIFITSIPHHVIYLSGNMAVSARIALMQHGIPIAAYIIFQLVNDLAIVLGFTITALIIFKHKSDDWMSIFVSLALVTFGVTITSLESTSSSLNSLRIYHPGWQLPITLLQGIGLGSLLLVFYLFPDGRFVPRWTRLMSYLWGIWLIAWIILPGDVDTQSLSPTANFVMRMLVSDTSALERVLESLRVYSLVTVLVLWFGSGVFAQIYRYMRISTPLQRRQTKWAVYGLTASMVIYFWARLLPPFIIIALRSPGYSHLIYEIITLPIGTLALLLTPLSIGISIMRFRLWDVDFLINRTLVYGAVTFFLGANYLIVVIGFQLIFNKLFINLTGNQSTLFITISTLVITALFRPFKNWFQSLIDRRFFREKVSFRQVFTSFAREVRTIIDLPDLLRTLVNRTTDLLAIEYGAVYLHETNRHFALNEARSLPDEGSTQWQPEAVQLERLQIGQVVSQPQDPLYPMLVPLITPQAIGKSDQASPLLGVLALGPLRSGLHYSREDQALLLSLADQAGTAIYVAQLIQEAREETRRRIEAEQRLEDHRSSPLGRAEALAHTILQQPETALFEIHQLAQKAGKEPESAILLGNLPKVLQNFNAGPVASLAEGFNYLYESQFTPELFRVGLRTIINALSKIVKDTQSKELEAALAIYQLGMDAYDANTTAQIMDTKFFGDPSDNFVLSASTLSTTCCLTGLGNILTQLAAVTDALHAYERVDNTQDKLAYLASAVNALRHVDHSARVDLENADRPIVEHITESWLAIVTGAMSELQTSAHIVCQLLTRHTWQGDVVSLVLSLHNQGRGAALQVKTSLAPAPEYTVLDQTVVLDRLAPNEEAQVQLRIRPHLSSDADHFRARFIIHYTDPRGPDQVENFADVVHLLSTGGEFQFIPNPYVVGTPLKVGSPLFFGREDVVRFVQANLSASHRNNMVLIGQRRTGKTSLLKQLPARLGDEILPVYLDGQTLGLDPGMPNFFLTLATEITYALEDRDFEIKPPELSDFQASPAASFEHGFLERVRAAIGERHLLIMFDEFEELESAVHRGHLEPTIFGFLRHLIQHQANLSVIFCGTHRLEQLASDYWNVLFNISLYHHISLLQKEEALRLAEEPVSSFGMRYDDLALDKMWRVTAGHPYFLQLLCHSLVNHHNKTQRNYVTIADVNTALDDILSSGEAHFVYLWAESTSEERLVLTALSRMIPLTGQATPIQLIDFFDERGITIERQAVHSALHQLTLRDILQSNLDTDTSPGVHSASGEIYRWKLGLLGLWVEKYKSLSRVVDEAAARPEVQ